MSASPLVLTCFSDTFETLLVSAAGDFGLEHVEDAELTVEALQSLAWDEKAGEIKTKQ